MADLAEDAGDAATAARHRARADKTAAQLVDRRFDPALGRFVALTPAGRRTTVTPFALMPLLTGRLPEPVTAASAAQLADPASLGTLFPLPTVGLSEPEFSQDRMWRGPVWLNVNWLVVQGLLRSGLEGRGHRAGGADGGNGGLQWRTARVLESVDRPEGGRCDDWLRLVGGVVH